MEIIYLNKLKNAPPSPDSMTNRGISENEIIQLESSFNNGMMFPKALKELLFLAGDYCYVLDYGVAENQQELQDFVREDIEDSNKVITRPFYAIDVYGGYSFIFVYLDEGNDPPVYSASFGDDSSTWIRKISDNLSEYIKVLVEFAQKGHNPF
jgi:hypothetical protein